jgi:hypothetical protein
MNVFVYILSIRCYMFFAVKILRRKVTEESLPVDTKLLFEETRIWLLLATEPETKKECAVEGQQQITSRFGICIYRSL